MAGSAVLLEEVSEGMGAARNEYVPDNSLIHGSQKYSQHESAKDILGQSTFAFRPSQHTQEKRA